MAIENAWALVQAGVTPVVLRGRHIASVTRNGAGDYTVGFTEDMVSNSANYVASGGIMDPDPATMNHIDVAQVDDRHVRVRTHVTETPTDVNFFVNVLDDNDGSAAA